MKKFNEASCFLSHEKRDVLNISIQQMFTKCQVLGDTKMDNT